MCHRFHLLFAGPRACHKVLRVAPNGSTATPLKYYSIVFQAIIHDVEADSKSGHEFKLLPTRKHSQRLMSQEH